MRIVVLFGSLCAFVHAGELAGTVKLEATGNALHHATVLIPRLNLSTETDDGGTFRFRNVPAGSYDVVAQASGLSDERKRVIVPGSGAVEEHFSLRLSPIKSEITVTASGKVETALETFSSVTTIDTLELASKPATSLGDVLNGQPGVHSRSFGPGTSRPVLRGFDGDRVLVMQDGVRTGSLSSMSGDHGEPVDPQSLERVEVVRGPATLLYGSNAIGGVVNMITDHHQGQKAAHEGVHGYLSAIGGTNNSLHGGSAGVSAGAGNWVMRMNAGGQRTSDYSTARERIHNSAARTLSGAVSLARYSEKGWFNMAYNNQRGTYKIPPIELEAGKDGEHDHHHEDVQLPFTRHAVRFTGGMQDTGRALEGLNFSLNYSDWRHDEVGGGEVESQFFNKQLDYRLVMDQKRRGPLSGSFGVWGLNRQYQALGAEAYLPEVSQNSFAGFALQSLQFERARVQFGGRLENVRYAPETGRARNFTGFSGSAGVNLPLWNAGALVTNFNHSFRAPALEELYAAGPHVGNLTYEIGRDSLRRERNNGIDFSVRHSGGRLRAEWNAFYYRLSNFVYLAPTGDVEDGLIEARYSQSDARYVGVDAKLQYAVARNIWVQSGFDAVDAQLRVGNLSLPRIPPMRGRAGVDWRYRNFSLNPEIVIARRQGSIFTTETETAGYATANLRAGYTYATQHAMHLFSVNWFNANNAYYRNHLSFIKDFAAEMGRGVAVSYTVRFF